MPGGAPISKTPRRGCASRPTLDRKDVRPGDAVEAVGMPVPGPFSPSFAARRNAARRAAPRRSIHRTPTAEDALAGTCDSQLARLEATVVDHVSTLADQRLVVQAGDMLFNAHLPYERKEMVWPNSGALLAADRRLFGELWKTRCR
jgi:hypothetical protein